jgi:autotransporter-associated beta strand protein
MIKGKTHRLSGAAAIGLIFATSIWVQQAQAVSYWWDTTTTGLWSNTANWWTTAGGSATATVAPTSTDSVTFNGTGINGPAFVQLSTATSATGLTFANTGSTTLESSSTTPNSLFIGTGGITVSTGAGAVTLGDPVNLMPVTLTGAQTWTNNASTVMTVVNNIATGGNKLTMGAGQINITGNVTGNGLLATSNGTLSLSGGSNAFNGLSLGSQNSSAISAALNISGGTTTIAGRIGMGGATGARGILNISNTATVTVTGDFIMFGGNATGGNAGTNLTSCGVVNQSGGVFNVNTTSGVLMAWAGNAYGAYQLSGGTLNGPNAAWNVDNQNTTYGFFSQSGGVSNFINTLQINQNSSGPAIVDVSGGTMTHKTAGNFMNTLGANALGVLTVRGSGYLQEQTGNFFVTGSNTAANGIVNLLTGGTIEANRIQRVTGASAKATINLDGGTLRAYSTNAGSNFLAGLDNAMVYPAGVTVDTNNQSITIGQALTAPAGFGVGLSGGSIAVASGGSGYIAPPVVSFAAPASGVAATGVAVLTNGVVTGITITSPGSGYTSGQSVAVTFNGGSNAANEAASAAPSFNATASTALASGGLTKVNNGTLTLSGVNTYAGPTAVNQGTLVVNGTLGSTSTVSVASGATLSGSGTIAGANVANGGILSGIAGSSFNIGNLNFSGAGLISATLGAGNASNPMLAVTGSVTSSGPGTVNVNVTNTPADGTYQLLSYGIGGNPFSALSLNSRVYSLADNGTYAALTVNSAAAPDAIWTGQANSDWSLATEPGPKNWLLSSGGTADFLAGDKVVFDDTAGTIGGGTTNVAINNGNVWPYSTTFNNNGYNYSLTGSNGIASGNLTMNGSGLVTISSNNSFPGPVNLNSGKVSVASIGNSGNNGPLGSGASVNLAGGSLLYTGSGETNNRGYAFNSGGTLSVSNATAALGLSGVVSGVGSIVKAGPGILSLSSSSNSYSGGLTVSQGTAVLSYAPAANTSYAWLANGITLGDGNTGANNVQLTLGAGINSTDATVATVAVRQLGTITVNALSSGTAVIDVTAPTVSEGFALALNGPVMLNGPHNQVLYHATGAGAGAGNYSLIINPGANNTLVFTADGTASNFAGNVHVISGKWQMQNNAYVANDVAHQNLCLPATASVTVDAGATWAISHGEQTIDNLNGAGTVNYGGGNFLGPQLVLGGNNNVNGGSFTGTLNGTTTVGKTGTGTQELSGSGITYSGSTALTNGTLKLTNVTGWASNVSFNNDPTTTPSLMLNTLASTDAYTINNKALTGGTSTASIVKTGPGTVTLSPSNGSTFVGNSTGAIAVNQGTLVLTNSFVTAPSVSVANGANLGSAATMALASLTFSGTSIISGTLGTSTTSTAPINVVGALTTGGVNSILINPSVPNGEATGTYHFIQYGSNTSPEGYSAYQFANPVRALTIVTTDPGYLDLNYNASNYPIWSGTNSSAFTGGNNWKLSSNGSTTDFLPADNVWFDDTATGTTTVNVNANVAPSTTTFNNNALSYTLMGTGAITNGVLTKSGTGGLLTITNNNSFTGGVYLNGGTVSVGTLANISVAQPLGQGALNFQGGVLEYSGSSTSTNYSIVTSSSGGALAIDNTATTLTLTSPVSGSGTLGMNGPGTLTLGAGAAATIAVNAGTANWSVGASGPIKINGGTVNLPNATSTGAIAVNGGTLNLVGGTFSGAISGTSVININSGDSVATTNLGSGTADTTPNTFSGTTYVTGRPIVLNKAPNTPAIGGNIVFQAGYWAHGYHMYPASDNVFAPGTTLTFASTNNTLYEFRFAGHSETLAGLNCSNLLAIVENAGYNGSASDTGLAAATLTLNGTGSYSYNGSLRDQNGGTNGALSLVYQGPGNQILARDISYTGPTTISGGVLTFYSVVNPAAGIPSNSVTLSGGVMQLGNSTGTTFNLTRTLGNSAGQIQLTGGTTGFSALGAPVNISLSGGATVQWGSTYFQPAALVLGANTANNTTTLQNPIDLNGAQQTVVVNANTSTLSGVLSDSTSSAGGLRKSGGGTLVLTNTSTYAGATNVNSGTLYVNGALNLASTVTVAGGTTLGGKGQAGVVNVAAGGSIEGGQGGVGTLSLTDLAFAGSGSVNVTPAAYPYVPLIVSDNNGLAANGGTAAPVMINLAGPALQSGPYHLIQYTGEIQGPNNSGGFQLGLTPGNAHSSYTLVDDSLDGYLNLNVVLNPVVWTGSASNSWDSISRLPGTTNWYLQSGGSAADFIANDQVIFDDTGSTGNVVINSGNVSIGSVTFNNNLLNYTISGSNGITGAGGLTVNGSRSVTITTTNSFTGPVAVNGGTLAVPTITNGGSPSAIGAGTNLSLGNGATLEYTGAGAATSNRAVAINAGGGAISVDNPAASLALTGSLTGSDPLTKNGQGILSLGGTAAAYSGAIAVGQGTLAFNSNLAVAGSAVNVTLGAANTGANAVTMLFDTGLAHGVPLSNVYTTNYGTAQTIVLNAGSGLAANGQDFLGVLNLAGSVPLTIKATNTGGHTTAQDWTGQIVGNGVPAGSTALLLDGTTWPLRLTFTGGSPNNFTGNVVMTGTVSTQGVTFSGQTPGNQNLGFLNNSVTVSPSATWTVVWGGETVEGLNGSGNISLNNQNALNNIGLTIGNNDASSTFSGNITGNFGIDKTGTGTLVLTGAAVGGIPTSGSSFGGPVVVDNGTLVVAAVANGSNSVLGTGNNGRSITVNAGGTLKFIAPNATATGFSSTNVPTLNINGGTVTNAEPGAPFPVGTINNALNNVTLTNGLLTAATGQHGAYAAWNINGTITSSGTSTISTSDPVYGTVMLSSTAPAFTPGTTTVNVTDGTLTVSAPLVQDNDPGDNKVSALTLTGAGTLVLSASNNYTGGTTVYGGTLIATNVHAIADGTNLSVGDPTLLSMLPAPVVPSAAVPVTPASAAAVPEPGTLALLATMLGGAVAYRRCRRKRSSLSA